MPSILIRREQATAQFARERVQKAIGAGKDVPKEYKAYVRKLPMMIKQNGLIAALAFVNKKHSEKAYELLETNLTDWFARAETPVTIPAGTVLYARFVNLPPAEYIAATRYAQQLLLWLKRMSEAMIEVK